MKLLNGPEIHFFPRPVALFCNQFKIWCNVHNRTSIFFFSRAIRKQSWNCFFFEFVKAPIWIHFNALIVRENLYLMQHLWTLHSTEKSSNILIEIRWKFRREYDRFFLCWTKFFYFVRYCVFKFLVIVQFVETRVHIFFNIQGVRWIGTET